MVAWMATWRKVEFQIEILKSFISVVGTTENPLFQ